MTRTWTDQTLATQAADSVVAQLTAEQSELVRDSRTSMEVHAQVTAIATAALRLLHENSGDVAAADISESIGRRRAGTNIHPTESLRAASLAFHHIYPLLVETLPEFSAQGAIDIASALQTVIGDTIVAAATGYVDTLLDRLSAVNGEARRAVSRELHDRTMQGLAAALQQITLLPTPVEAISRILSETLAETRSLALELRQIVGDRGLDDALSAYLTDIREVGTGMRAVNLIQTGAPRRLRALTQEQAFIITREAVQNAVRHASASHITVGLVWRLDSLLISVADDGIGFDRTSVSHERIGLAGSGERAQTIGASFEVCPAPGGGTLMRLEVPE